MASNKTAFHERIESGKPLLLAEIHPPGHGNGEAFRSLVRPFGGKVHALGLSDNRDGIRMSAMAAASLAAAEGVEPIQHMTSRDRNRIALQGDLLGASALGIRNLLITSGTHQTLGACGQARNVYDLDPVQLLKAFSDLDGEPRCLGAVASPFADPMELQIMRLGKKVRAGAAFLITQPVFDLDRFMAWWEQVRAAGLHEKVAILASIQPLTDGVTAKNLAQKRPTPRLPEAVVERITSETAPEAQRAAGMTVAVETIQRLQECEGLRGFDIQAGDDPETALEIMKKAGLGTQ